MTEALYIRNMVCHTCLRVVRDLVLAEGYPISHIELGKVEVESEIPVDRAGLRAVLEEVGFELVEEPRSRIANSIKSLIIDLIFTQGVATLKTPLSAWLSEKLGRDYAYLSAAFHSETGTTVERYALLQRVEYVKELLQTSDSTLEVIAARAGYSSSAYLANQFKRVTGFTPTAFRKAQGANRIPLEQVGRIS